MNAALLSHFGKLVYFDESQRSVLQIHPRDVTAQTPLLRLPAPGSHALKFVAVSGRTLTVSASDLRFEPAFASVPLAAVPAPDHSGLVAIRAGEQIMCAAPDGSIAMSARAVNEWELFLPLDPLALNDLRALLRHDWVAKGAGTRALGHLAYIADQKTLNFGGGNIAIADLPLAEAERVGAAADFAPPLSGILFRDGWKHDRLMLFNPLIVYVIFGNKPELLRQLHLSSHSLHLLGRYAGDILVIGDQPREVLAPVLPEALRHRLMLHPMTARDRMDVVAARLAIGDLPRLHGHQPVLYADADIIFDAPVAPVLEALAVSDHFSAQLENFNELGVALSVGGSLFQEDPMRLKQKFGFNAGLLGMPGAWRAGPALRTAATALARFSAANGRDALPWYEQSMLNYSLHRLDMFNPEPISSRTEICALADRLDVAKRRGFVHFWAAANRPAEMEKYLTRIFESLRRDALDRASSLAS